MLAQTWRLLSWIESEQNYTMRFALLACGLYSSPGPDLDAECNGP